MRSVTLQVKLAHSEYPIVIEAGLLDRLGPLLAEYASHCFVISDQTVSGLYAARLLATMASTQMQMALISVPPGEGSKSFAQAEQLLNKLLSQKADRRAVVVALGGGVVGDLAGFVAATYMRGIRLVQIPTTLLAQVDSSVGGKVGVNLPQAKNSVGAFWQPTAVYIDPTLLSTLDEPNYTAGLAEVVKYGVIMDEPFFAFLENNTAAINARDPDVLTEITEKCCRLKASVVQEDERETTGRRAILNYGHTFGHAIEAVFGYGTWLHGHAVAMGMGAAANLAKSLDRVDAAFVVRQTELLAGLGIPTKFPQEKHTEMLDAMRMDKKAAGGQVRFVLPTRLGHAELVSSVDPQQVLDAMRSD